MKKEKTIRTYQRRTKTGKVVTVKQHTAKYDAAEALKEAAKKKGAGDELEALKKKKPVAQKEEVKSPYEEYGFTKDEFKEWYEGTGSKADKKVEKALKKAMGAKAYNALSDKAADEYKKGGAHRFFTKGLEEMKASTSASTKSVTSGKETKDESLKVGSSIQMGNSTSLGKGKKETFKVLAVQKTNKQDRELGNTEAAWVQRKDGSVTLALKDSEKGWMYDDTWTDFTDRKHPYAKSLEAAGYSFKKAQGKGGKYWEVSKGKTPKPFKHTDGGTSVEYDAAYAKMNKLIAKHGGVPKKDHKDYAKYKEVEKYANDFKAGKVGGTAKEVSPKVAKETKKLTERILGKKTSRRESKDSKKVRQVMSSPDDFKAFLKVPTPAKGSKGYAAHMALRSVARNGGLAGDDSVRDSLVRNGYPKDKAYTQGIKEVLALAKKHNLRW